MNQNSKNFAWISYIQIFQSFQLHVPLCKILIRHRLCLLQYYPRVYSKPKKVTIKFVGFNLFKLNGVRAGAVLGCGSCSRIWLALVTLALKTLLSNCTIIQNIFFVTYLLTHFTAGMPNRPASDLSGTGLRKLTIPQTVRYRNKET
jgi:hypothetical protein